MICRTEKQKKWGGAEEVSSVAIARVYRAAWVPGSVKEAPGDLTEPGFRAMLRCGQEQEETLPS